MPGQTRIHMTAPRRPPRPSMEGRARARPNHPGVRHAAPCAVLQWRAGHVPGQTRPHGAQLTAGPLPSMEGRARARPNAGGAAPANLGLLAFNGGPGTCPAKPAAPRSSVSPSESPSMEGRARARPNEHPPASPGGATLPSMEGRARARPNPSTQPTASWRSHCAFNGGPGTCPAKRGLFTRSRLPAFPSMEGRARARPNKDRGGVRMVDGTPSMEGRARARPNFGSEIVQTQGDKSFNGGPGTCPAKPRLGGPLSGLPGSFNGGPGTCPAKRGFVVLLLRGFSSLQWRAGHVPGQTTHLSQAGPSPRHLQWRAGHVPGQTGGR